MIRDFLDVLSLQPQAWRFIIVVVFGLVCGVLMGMILTVAELLCDETLGSPWTHLQLRIRLWDAKRRWRIRQQQAQARSSYQRAQSELETRRVGRS